MKSYDYHVMTEASHNKDKVTNIMDTPYKGSFRPVQLTEKYDDFLPDH